jgi:hypothetical protein
LPLFSADSEWRRIVDAIKKIQAEGASMCEAHEDLEVFRLRLGKCLNYEVDTIGLCDCC